MTRKLTLTTLKKRADFLRLNRGKKETTPYFILRYAPSGLEGCRVGFTVTTKCGNAVTRNRIKRRLRVIARELLPQATPGIDYVLIARAEASDKLCNDKLDHLRAAFEEVLKKVKP